MKSKTVALLLSDLGIDKIHSRPHINNDNPYSEAQFKTLKYCPQFPENFASIQDSRQFCLDFFIRYYKDHRHSSVAYLTLEQVHYGLFGKILKIRSETLTNVPFDFLSYRPITISPFLAEILFLNVVVQLMK
jgi:putative transposase